MQVGCFRIDKQEAGDDLALGVALLQVIGGADAVGGVVILVQLAQAQD